MAGDKIRTHDAVAVEKYAVGPARSQYRVIANLRGPEAKILMPDMLETAADFRLPVFYHPSGGRPRAIVRHNDLESGVALPRKRSQDRIERIFAVIGRNDDRDQFSHITTLTSV